MRSRLHRTILACALAATPTIAHAAAPPAKAAPKLTRAPELLEFVAAPHPEGELNGAAVVLKLQIDIEGRVTSAAVTESAGPTFDEPARAAVLKFRFSPAEVDGKPSPIKILYRYEFKPPTPPPPPTTARRRCGLLGCATPSLR